MENTELNFTITVAETNVILAALGKQPFDSVAGLINKLQIQAQPQLQNIVPEPKTPQE